MESVIHMRSVGIQNPWKTVLLQMISVLFSFGAGHNDCVSDGVSRVDEGDGLL